MRITAVGIALLLVACTGNTEPGTEPDEPLVIDGEVTLISNESGPADNIYDEYSHNASISDEHGYACRGDGGYSDQREGAQVTVRDGDGSTLGVGRMSAGEYLAINKTTKEPIDLDTFGGSEEEFDSQGNFNYRGMCRFRFEIEVDESDYYAIQVANRNELVHTREELEEAGWSVAFTLGP